VYTPTYCFVDNLYIHIYTRDAKREIPRAIMRPSRIINRSRLVHSLVNTLGYYNCSTTYIYSLWHDTDAICSDIIFDDISEFAFV